MSQEPPEPIELQLLCLYGRDPALIERTIVDHISDHISNCESLIKDASSSVTTPTTCNSQICTYFRWFYPNHYNRCQLMKEECISCSKLKRWITVHASSCCMDCPITLCRCIKSEIFKGRLISMNKFFEIRNPSPPPLTNSSNSSAKDWRKRDSSDSTSSGGYSSLDAAFRSPREALLEPRDSLTINNYIGNGRFPGRYGSISTGHLQSSLESSPFKLRDVEESPDEYEVLKLGKYEGQRSALASVDVEKSLVLGKHYVPMDSEESLLSEGQRSRPSNSSEDTDESGCFFNSLTHVADPKCHTPIERQGTDANPPRVVCGRMSMDISHSLHNQSHGVPHTSHNHTVLSSDDDCKSRDQTSRAHDHSVPQHGNDGPRPGAKSPRQNEDTKRKRKKRFKTQTNVVSDSPLPTRRILRKACDPVGSPTINNSNSDQTDVSAPARNSPNPESTDGEDGLHRDRDSTLPDHSTGPNSLNNDTDNLDGNEHLKAPLQRMETCEDCNKILFPRFSITASEQDHISSTSLQFTNREEVRSHDQCVSNFQRSFKSYHTQYPSGGQRSDRDSDSAPPDHSTGRNSLNNDTDKLDSKEHLKAPLQRTEIYEQSTQLREKGVTSIYDNTTENRSYSTSGISSTSVSSSSLNSLSQRVTPDKDEGQRSLDEGPRSLDEDQRLSNKGPRSVCEDQISLNKGQRSLYEPGTNPFECSAEDSTTTIVPDPSSSNPTLSQEADDETVVEPRPHNAPFPMSHSSESTSDDEEHDVDPHAFAQSTPGDTPLSLISTLVNCDVVIGKHAKAINEMNHKPRYGGKLPELTRPGMSDEDKQKLMPDTYPFDKDCDFYPPPANLQRRGSDLKRREEEMYRETLEQGFSEDVGDIQAQMDHRTTLKEYLLGQFYSNKLYRENLDWTRHTKLGKGAQACCYSIRDCTTNCLLVLKEESENKKTIDEAYISLKLAHQSNPSPNVIEYYTAALLPGKCCNPSRFTGEVQIFMEHMPACLQGYLFKCGPIPLHTVHHYACQLFDAIDFLHSRQQIIHCDIKPGNILLDETAQRIKLTDFGAAELLEENRRDYDKCFIGDANAGTLSYNPPEFYRDQQCSFAFDIWQAGCCVMAMCTGRRPWRHVYMDVYPGKQPDQLTKAMKQDHKRMISCQKDGHMCPAFITETLRQVVQFCLHGDPLQRPTARDCAYLLNMSIAVDDNAKVKVHEAYQCTPRMLERLQDVTRSHPCVDVYLGVDHETVVNLQESHDPRQCHGSIHHAMHGGWLGSIECPPGMTYAQAETFIRNTFPVSRNLLPFGLATCENSPSSIWSSCYRVRAPDAPGLYSSVNPHCPIDPSAAIVLLPSKRDLV